MLYKWVRQFVEKFSFITKTEFKKGIFYIYYEKDDKQKVKHLPYRANRDMLLNIIDKIKKDINYEKIKKERDKKIRAALKKEREKETIFKLV